MTISELNAGQPRPIEALEDVSYLSESIESGKAFLRVLAYPWGVEFDVCDVEGMI